MKNWIWAVAMAGLCATPAVAEWQTVAEVTAGGATKELAVDREIRVIELECLSGPVQVNTLWVLEGEAETPIAVMRQFQAGDTQDIDLGGDRSVTGLRISDGGTGQYRVRTQ